jgi:hypothetical protein
MNYRKAIFVSLSIVFIVSSCKKKEHVQSRPVLPVTASGPAGGATEKQTSKNAPAHALRPEKGPSDLSKLVVDQKKGWYGWYNPAPGDWQGNWAFEKTLPDSTFGGLFFVQLMPPDQPQDMEEYAKMLLRQSPFYDFTGVTAKEELPDGWIIKGMLEIPCEPEEAPWEGPGFVIMRRIDGTVILCVSERLEDEASFNEAVEMCRSAAFK